MSKVKHLLAGVAVASTVGLAAPAVGSAAPPQVQPPEPGTWCGVVPGTFVDTITSDVERQADGNAIDHFTLMSVFTASETGRSIISSASSTSRSTGPIDNGDGTFGFVTQISGLVLKFQIPNGPVLKAANGEPIRSAGTLAFEDVFSSTVPSDETYITTIDLGFDGPHLARQGVDICGPSVDYLLGS
jgi:hypothetical protein